MEDSDIDAVDIHFDDSFAEKYLLEEVNRRRKKYWINKQGQRVDISKMDDQYLLNCLSLVRRTNQYKENMWYIAEMTDDYGDRA